jgi:glycosyltransferase involved in cell wall biosynthesis
MINSAVFSVVYPGVERYIPEFLCSLSKQTDKDFSLFLINDGLADLEIFLKKVDFDVQVVEKVGLPAKLRKIGIEWVVSKGAEIIIFADADDYFENNRIEVSKKMLVHCDIVCNEMLLVGEEVSQPTLMLEKFFDDKTEINISDIATGNCMGLSNTALRIDSISRDIESIPNNIIAFDWALFAMCIHAGARAVFTKETQTYYRQHNNNTAFIQCFSEQQIIRGVKVKRDHYQLLSKFYKEYVSLADLFESLFSRLQNNNSLKQKYCQAVKQHGSNVSLWWEPIKSFEDLGL